jgi:ribonuclease Z
LTNSLQIVFLGTSAGVPTRARNVSCVALRLPQRGETWLFDCGEGTQHQILSSDLKFSQITRIFITHLHGDHLFGLMGLLATCGMAGHASHISVYGPPGLEDYVRENSSRTEIRFSYPVDIHTVKAGTIFEDEEFRVTCSPLKHRVTTYGYRVEEKDRPGHFDVERASALGIPSGPLYGKLKRGEQVTLSDGRVIDGATLCGPTEKGRRVVYCTDTIYCQSAIELSRDADLLIHEATFAQADEGLARQSMHSTTGMAARVALAAKTKLLIMTHFSPRYVPGNPIEPDQLLREARAIFPHTEMARDFMTFDVPRRDENRG